MTQHQDIFSNTAMTATYADETPRKVPGLADLHRMGMLLLSEQAPPTAHILVVGAGGGMELKAMAEARGEWTFTGVDPSAAMLDLERRNVASFEDRIWLVEGTVEAVPATAFDGATCLLTLHFLDRSERLRMLREIRRRLKPGARLVIAHHSGAREGDLRWLARTVAFADRTGEDWPKAAESAAAIADRLHLLPEAEEEELLHRAGFGYVGLFYAAFSFRGWVATAGPA